MTWPELLVVFLIPIGVLTAGYFIGKSMKRQHNKKYFPPKYITAIYLREQSKWIKFARDPET